MSTHYPNLFSPIKIGNVEVPNRIAMMPMGVFSPRLMDLKTGAYTKDGADYYIERAKGGTGLIITGLVPIIPLPGMNPVNFPDEYVEKLSYLINGIHEQGSRIFIQLTAGLGRVGNPQCLVNRLEFPRSASFNPNWYMKEVPCLRLSDGRLKKIIKNIGEMLDSDGELTLKNIQCVHKGKRTPLQEIQYTCKEGINIYSPKFHLSFSAPSSKSSTVSAATLSATGTARTAMQGSCLPRMSRL